MAKGGRSPLSEEQTLALGQKAEFERPSQTDWGETLKSGPFDVESSLPIAQR
jgi:hypothetical protein